jgi:hypothetical protein
MITSANAIFTGVLPCKNKTMGKKKAKEKIAEHNQLFPSLTPS